MNFIEYTMLEAVSVRITRVCSNRDGGCTLARSPFFLVHLARFVSPFSTFDFLSQLCTNLHAPWTSLALVLFHSFYSRCSSTQKRVDAGISFPSIPCPGDTFLPAQRDETGARCFHLKVARPPLRLFATSRVSLARDHPHLRVSESTKTLS